MNNAAVKNDAARNPEREGEPVKLRRRIGSTTYTLTIKFSETATETADEKILRLIEREVGRNA
ncbi:MAG: transposon-encoded TnpW family protein [Oscillospiraceae bacterium]|nr:transposon-encoded TnpW family protein [Oscillospiraceae bacterium]